jgi:hypothetical protein
VDGDAWWDIPRQPVVTNKRPAKAAATRRMSLGRSTRPFGSIVWLASRAGEQHLDVRADPVQAT